MLARSNSLIFSPVSNFDYRSMPRSKEPEIFTFEPVPLQYVPLRNTSFRPRRKNTRVMYPANVRKYLPKPEKSPAKRWLLILCLVVFLQIYTEEPNVEATTTQSAAESSAPDVTSEDLSFSQYQMLPFESAEQQARQMKSLAPEFLMTQPRLEDV
ncbi:radiation-inducible immediate-early gene IEX-1 [Conger conger]|uniref:radiation-inducible immediate-early gene IEX-1 n=1 Tax=Conger conger TaxID=82655 RepID=UPI002A5AB308|nr:radiation-inducible immediate-early gene IEX-1 [Conger conger]